MYSFSTCVNKVHFNSISNMNKTILLQKRFTHVHLCVCSLSLFARTRVCVCVRARAPVVNYYRQSFSKMSRLPEPKLSVDGVRIIARFPASYCVFLWLSGIQLPLQVHHPLATGDWPCCRVGNINKDKCCGSKHLQQILLLTRYQWA